MAENQEGRPASPCGPPALLPHEHTHPWALGTSVSQASTYKFGLLRAPSPGGGNISALMT